MVPYFENVIVPDLKAGKTVLIAAHGNSLRSLVMYLDELTPEQILEVNIPTAIPHIILCGDLFAYILIISMEERCSLNDENKR